MSAGELAPKGNNGPGPGEGEGQASSHREYYSESMMSCPVCGAITTTGGIQHESWCNLVNGAPPNGETQQPIVISAGGISIGIGHDLEQSIREARALSRAWAAYADELERSLQRCLSASK